ncbi:MAG: DMT family transporter [Verrucomicrobiales bacterium]
MPNDYVKLHFVVILWGFTAILGRLINLESPVIVTYRVASAGLMLAILIIALKIPYSSTAKVRITLTANGLLLGLHWTLFFLAVEIANVSVCMIGMATATLWTAFLEPLLIKKRRLHAYNIAIGVVMIGAITIIAGSDFQYMKGLLVAVASAGVATTFSIFNSRFSRNHHHYVIALHQMAGATLFCTVAIAIVTLTRGSLPNLIPSPADAGWLLLLASFCTVYAYAQYIELLKRLTVFTIHLAYNLEPVYGIILAALFFKEHRQLGSMFYLGAAIILVAVIVHPFIVRAYTRRFSNS